jgi:hypothetical protein
MRFTLQNADGSQATLQFPDKQAQWPRLMYHRHFMLSEFLHSSHVPPPDTNLAAADQAAFRSWQNDRNRFEMIRDSYLDHVKTRYAADSATVTRIEHQLPSSQDVLENKLPLDDPRLYIELPDEPFDADPFTPPETPGEPAFINPAAVFPAGPTIPAAPLGGEVLPN